MAACGRRWRHLLAAICLLLAVETIATGQRVPEYELLATVNDEPVAENYLGRGRELAASGDYAGAALMYAAAARQVPNAVVPAEERLWLPVWRRVAEDLAAWPPQGLAAYRETVDTDAEQWYRKAVADGDMAALERAATAGLMSSVGPRAALLMADRMREAGRFALSLYYYDLLLAVVKNSGLDANEVRAKALFSARLAGLDDVAHRLTDELQRSGRRETPDLAGAAAGGEPPQSNLSGGRDLATGLPAVVPATVAWLRPLAQAALRSKYLAASTPTALPVYRDGRIYVLLQTSAWCIDAASGEVLWRYDSAGRTGHSDPVDYLFEQAHRPLVIESHVITPVSSGDRVIVQSQYADTAELVALDRRDGRPAWHWRAIEEDIHIAAMGVGVAPVMDDSALFAALGTTSGFFGEVASAAFDPATGQMLWRQQLGSHYNQMIVRNMRALTMPFAKAQAIRGGILLTAGAGLLTAQSAAGGAILWARQIPLRPSDTVLSAEPLRELPGQPFGGEVNGRLAQVLVRGGAVFGGDVATTQTIACDLLTGRKLWSRDAEGSAQLLALVGSHVLAWGRTLRCLDADTGDSAWELAPQHGEVIAGTPLATREHVLVPTNRRLLLVGLATGAVERAMVWPTDRTAGNLLLTPQGLVVAEPRTLVCYRSWDLARRELVAAAKADPADASSLLELGGAAMRLGRFREALKAFDQARERLDWAAEAARLYRLYEEMLNLMDEPARAASADDVFARMLACAAEPETIAREGLLEGRHYVAVDPARSVAALHRAFISPEVRTVRIRDTLLGDGPAGVLAEQMIRRIVATHGSALLEPFETRATEARRSALAREDRATALVEAAMRFPLTRSASAMLEEALGEYEVARRHDEAAALCRRLVAAAPAGERQWALRLRLAENLSRVGEKELAAAEASALIHLAPPGATVTDAHGTRNADKAAARFLRAAPQVSDAAPAVDMPSGPYAPAWTFKMPLQPAVTRGPTADCRDAKTRARQPLLAVGVQGIWALSRSDGKVVWEKRDPAWRAPRPVVPVLRTPRLAVFGLGDEVVALDPMTGDERWRTPVHPPGAAFAEGDSVLGWMTYGANIRPGRPPLQVLALRLHGGLVCVETNSSLHLLDPRDGFSVTAVGRPTATGTTFVKLGDWTAAGAEREEGCVLFGWDLLTRRPLPDVPFPDPITLLCRGAGESEAAVLGASRDVALVQLGHGGGEVWQRQIDPPPDRRGVACRLGDLLIVGTFDGALTALKNDTGQTAWTVRLANRPHGAAEEAVPLDADLLVRCPQLVARIGPDGKAKWRHRLSSDGYAAEAVPAGKRVLVIGRQRRDGRTVAFLETLNTETGKSDGRAELAEPYGCFRVFPDEGGLLVVASQSARFYAPAKR